MITIRADRDDDGTLRDTTTASDGITIRPYNDDDWPEVCRVHDRARPDELNGSCDPRAFVPLVEDAASTNIHTSRKYVACDGGRVVGFVGIEGNYLSWLYVDPDYYGRGIGRRLLRFAVDRLEPGGWALCLAGNDRALGLYQSEGFRIIRAFEGNNGGYPCLCVRLELR